MNEEIREIDHSCRWGGEEFLVICPESDRPGAEPSRLAERLRESIEQNGSGCKKFVSASFGVAEFSGIEGEGLPRRKKAAPADGLFP